MPSVVVSVVGRRLLSRLETVLEECTITGAPDGANLSTLAESGPDLVIARADSLPQPVERWVEEVRGLAENPDVILLHDSEDPRFGAALLEAGCVALLRESLTDDDLGEALAVLVGRRHDRNLLAVKARSPIGRSSLDDFVSESPRMREFMAVARKVVGANSSLLLLGETGTGKERLGRAIHEEGPRSAGPFLAVNCGALPESLLESELFGHEKGAFTGASRARKGYFEQAHGGTLFLDEIGEVPLHLQVKLLRVIEDHRVQRVGGERSFPVDVRIVAATNRDLEEEARVGRFRRDLFYRLAVVTLALPALRARAEDIPALVRSYLDHFRTTLDKPVLGVSVEARAALAAYEWPGNVRELINVVERAVLLTSNSEIGLRDLPRAIAERGARRARGGTGPERPVDAPPSWIGRRIGEARREVILEFERRYLTALLESTRGRIGETARSAGINERSLYELMQRHHLHKEDFRSGRTRKDAKGRTIPEAEPRSAPGEA